jgi:hypothetical protein
MGLWGKIKNAVKEVAEAVEDFVNDVGDAVGDTVEAVGDAVNDVLNWIGDKIGGKPFFSWLGGIVKGGFAVLGALIKGIFGIIGGSIGGIIKILGGIFTGQGNLILEGIWDLISPIIGTIIVVVGKFIASVQSIFYAQGFERPLTDEEKKQLKRVFKGCLNYYVIRIIEGHAGLFGISSKPFVLGNTIYMKTETFTIDLLVHETTHVWQYQQTGDRYASDAIAAQWFVPDEYSWQREIDVRNKNDWSDFNNEAQAEFFQDLWKIGELRDSSGTTLQTGNGSFFDADGKKKLGYFEVSGKDYTNIATKAVKTVRNEWF